MDDEMDDSELATALVREAGGLAARMLADGLRVQRKTSVSDVVSAADHAAEDLIAARLRTERPDDAVIGEEGTSSDGGTGRCWYVDPVDGTYNFLSGLPIWCSAVGLTDAGVPTLGAVYAPRTDELWAGGAGVPVTLNGNAVEPLPQRGLDRLSLAAYLHPTTLRDPTIREPMLRVMSTAATVRMLGSGSVELASVATGRLGAWVQYTSAPWDWVPGAALVTAAGGVATKVPAHGHGWQVAGNRQVVEEITALLTAEIG